MGGVSPQLTINKYLIWSNYIRKARLSVARCLLKLGIPLINTTNVDGFSIRFKTSTFLEYFLRAEESYSREAVTMHWIRNCVSDGDVVMDIGANVGAYSQAGDKCIRLNRKQVTSVRWAITFS